MNDAVYSVCLCRCYYHDTVTQNITLIDFYKRGTVFQGRSKLRHFTKNQQIFASFFIMPKSQVRLTKLLLDTVYVTVVLYLLCLCEF